MGNVSDKSCRENQNISFVFVNGLFFENLTVYKIMCKNIVQSDGPQMAIWRTRIVCWIPKVTNTVSEHVTAFFFFNFS